MREGTDGVATTLRFTGKTLVLDGRSRKFEYPAASGKTGRYAPIPAGRYWIATDQVYELGPGTDYVAKTLAAILTLSSRSRVEDRHHASWGRYRIPIHQSAEQQRRTGRSGLFIHGGSAFGSAGCIDLAEWIDVFVDHLRAECPGGERREIPLLVD